MANAKGNSLAGNMREEKEPQRQPLNNYENGNRNIHIKVPYM